ncbi:lysostaphin resistance A-like protein [Luteibacter sp. CQ10]|uniref:lysostaphin resistance A-like protein n=1 Tax=Luteibacter sp. CQ10 TaxID=2805821 RepID=UPI0034A59210
MPHDSASPALSMDADLSAPPERVPGLVETLLCILGYFALQFGFGGLFGALSQLISRQFPQNVPAAPDRLIVVVILTLICSATITIAVLVRRWGARATEGGLSGLGFTPPDGRHIAFATVLGFAAPILGGLLTSWLAGGHDVSQAVSDIADKAHLGMRAALVPIAVVVGPLVEEVLFRGAFLATLRARMGDGGAIAVSAAVFGLVHLPDLDWLWYAVPNLVLVGLFCAWLRVRSRSIWPAFVTHAVNNAMATVGWFMR